MSSLDLECRNDWVSFLFQAGRAEGAFHPIGPIATLAGAAAFQRGISRAGGIADDHQPGGDPDPRMELDGFDVEAADRVDDTQPCSHRPLGIVLMRSGVAEIDEHAVAHVLGDKAVEPGDDRGGRTMICGDDLAQILGIEARGERSRADQVAEHHRQLTALGIRPHPCLPCKRRREGERAPAVARDRQGWRRRHIDRAERGNGVEQPSAMPDQIDTEILQIFGRQSPPEKRHRSAGVSAAATPSSSGCSNAHTPIALSSLPGCLDAPYTSTIRQR
jgi:hypothetical protein